VFQNRAEAAYIMSRLKPTLDEEFRKSGFTNLVEVGLGSDVLFSREPVQTMDDLRKRPLWIWSLDEIMKLQLPLIGVKVVPLPLERAAEAYESKQTDGFIALPTAALAFQWSAQVKYVTELDMGFLSGCLIVANRAFDALPLDAQRAMRAAAAKLQIRVEQMGREQDAAILKGMYARQGLTPVPVSPSLRAEFFQQAHEARDQLHEKLVPDTLYKNVMTLLADYRAEHH
jgi:TRAP-type C4-dicarboxylate transport system substrate-binding protein